MVEVVFINKDTPYPDVFRCCFQLHGCLEAVGERWDRRLVGLAILGIKAYLMHITEDDLRIREVYGQ